jgi:glycosyltransferase involved in cell wall biosynthesis
MRVLAAIVVPPHLSVSGGARAGELLSSALAGHCDMTIASMLSDGSVTAGLVRRKRVTSRLPPLVPWRHLPRSFSTLLYSSDLPEIVRQGVFDLVHIHNPLPALEMERVARAARASGIPYVVSTHWFNEVASGGEAYGASRMRRHAWHRLVEQPVARVVAGASGVFALSPADFPIVRAMGYAGPELIVVPNGVPVPAPSDAAADREVLAQLAIPPERAPGQITCMFLANHTPNKGLPILLEAFAGLEQPYLLIVGGERRPGIDYEGFQGRCRADQRIVVTGRIADAAVGALLRRSDLFVFPTLADTFPLVVLEAMVHGVPVLASRVGGIPHQIGGDCGWLVEPRDVAGLRAAVTRLAAEPAALAAAGRRAQARAQDAFTWQGAARTAAEGYRRVLERSRPREAATARPTDVLASP